MNSNAQTILIVEDEEPIRLLLARILSDVGYATVAAQTGDEALVILGQHSVQLILLDLHFPGQIDGEELLFELRDRGDEVPIIVVSGWVDDKPPSTIPTACTQCSKNPSSRTI